MKRLFKSLPLLVVLLAFSSIDVCAQSAPREDLLKEIAAKRAELQRLEDQFLSPADEDRAAFKGFLSQPDTGLIRLLPRDVYESEVYKKNQKTLTIRGGGAYYSFAKLTHEYGYGSDLSLESGYLAVGFAGADYGLMIELGDVALDEISIDHPSVRSLADYAAPRQESQARAEHLQTYAGLIRDGATYKSRLPVKIGPTFLLRSINYDYTDVLVAFRVVRKDTDGSLIIAWKLLKRFPKPELVRTIQAAN
jgi:hypothetical protein